MTTLAIEIVAIPLRVALWLFLAVGMNWPHRESRP